MGPKHTTINEMRGVTDWSISVRIMKACNENGSHHGWARLSSPKASRRSTCSRFVTIFTRSSQARQVSARPNIKLLKDGFSNLLFCSVKLAILHQPRDTSTIRFSCRAGSYINATTFAFPLHHMRQAMWETLRA